MDDYGTSANYLDNRSNNTSYFRSIQDSITTKNLRTPHKYSDSLAPFKASEPRVNPERALTVRINDAVLSLAASAIGARVCERARRPMHAVQALAAQTVSAKVANFGQCRIPYLSLMHVPGQPVGEVQRQGSSAVTRTTTMLRSAKDTGSMLLSCIVDCSVGLMLHAFSLCVLDMCKSGAPSESCINIFGTSKFYVPSYESNALLIQASKPCNRAAYDVRGTYMNSTSNALHGAL